MNNYHVRVIDSLEAWQEISASWNNLLVQSRSNNIFLTWEWLFSWTETFLNEKRTLFILAVQKSGTGEIIGIAPWCIHHITSSFLTIKQIEFLGTPEAGSDYLDVFSQIGKEGIVTLRIYDFLLEEAALLWDSIMLNDMPSNSLFYLHFQGKISQEGKFSEVTGGAYCPRVHIPTNLDEYFRQLSPNRRQQYRRHARLLEKDGEVAHQTFSGESAVEALDNFFSFYSEKTGYGGKSLHLLMKKFSSRCPDQNCVQVDFLRSNKHDIAAFLHLRYKDTVSLFLLAVDKAYNPKISIGNILVGRCVENAQRQKALIYDFLKGAEPYKFHWANNGTRSITFHFYQRKFAPIVMVLTRFLKNTVKLIVR
jgi:CelD/BcsL family acetyltransferase involved in cellulose biosynthesis